uniref:HEPN domain-containing protein n=1 Tax=Syphacia muris TaxID=451379 RepID=A0A0N5AJF7_9BILA
MEEEHLTGFYKKGLKEADVVVDRLRNYIATNKDKLTLSLPECARFDVFDWAECLIKAAEKTMRKFPEKQEDRKQDFHIKSKYVLKYARSQAETLVSSENNRKENT